MFIEPYHGPGAVPSFLKSLQFSEVVTIFNPHFADEEIEAQLVKVTYARLCNN